MKKGKDLMLKIANTIYGYATDCQFNVTTDTTEVTTTKYKRSNAAGKFKEFEPYVTSWDVNSSYVVAEDEADYKALVEKQLEGVAIDVEFLDVKDATSMTNGAGATGSIDAATTGIKYSGKAIITSIQLSAPTDGDATFSIQLQGTGTLTVATIS